MGALSAFPVSAIVKMAIGYISDLVEKISPDDLTEDEIKKVQKYVGSIYAGAKNFGPDLVASTDNDFDDLGLQEAFEVCEAAAVKYGLELDPQVL